MKPGSAHYPNLDLARLVAAFWVVMTHYFYVGPSWGLTGYATPGGILGGISALGHLGVAIFFVISGFVIPMAAERRSPSQFAVARFVRLYPGFIICMTLSSLALVMLGTDRAPDLAQWLANFIVLPQLAGKNFVDGVYWSLVYEILFYGWVFLLLAFGIFHERLTLICSVWLAITLADQLFIESAILERLLITQFSALFIIGLTGYSLIRQGFTNARLFLLFAALAIAPLGLGDFSILETDHGASARPSYASLLIETLFLTAFVAACILAPQLKARSKLLLALGGASYPLYLLHQEIGYALLSARPEKIATVIWAGLITASMLVLSWMIWKRAELPVRNWLLPRISPIAERLMAAIQAKRKRRSMTPRPS
ncbi:MAG: acyltransferase [Rhizobiaceae bacterium]